jgi:hypothetical protein
MNRRIVIVNGVTDEFLGETRIEEETLRVLSWKCDEKS